MRDELRRYAAPIAEHLGGAGANNHSSGGSRFAFPPSATRSTRGNGLGQTDPPGPLEHGIAAPGPAPSSSDYQQQQPRSFEQMIRSGGSKDKSNAK